MSNAPRSTAIRDRHRAAIKRERPPCGICNEPIDYDLPHTDPKSFVVDHVIPLNLGGSDELDNKQAAHRDCNRTKSDRVPAPATRQVILVCGPPGAGKTTYARSSGLMVYDLDDPEWGDSEAKFRQALKQLAGDSHAQAVVIRSGATLSAREKAAQLCGATRVVVINTDLETCIERIKERRRLKLPIKAQIASAQDWWRKYEPGAVSAGWFAESASRTFETSRAW